MITEKIKSLFTFINFLHSNIENFKQRETLFLELCNLDRERNKLHPQSSFIDKVNYDKIQNELEAKFDVFYKDVVLLIFDKATLLGIYNKTDVIHFRNLPLSELHKSAEIEDLEMILDIKKKYLFFRRETKYTYFQSLFFHDLDLALEELFSFFDENTKKEFEQLKEEYKKNEKQKVNSLLDNFNPDDFKNDLLNFNQNNGLNTIFDKALIRIEEPIFLKNLILEDSKLYDYVFEQYKQAPLIADWTKFLEYNYEEYNLSELYEAHRKIESERPHDGIARFYSSTPYENQIRVLHEKYLDLLVNESLDTKFFIPDLSKTLLFIVGTNIESCVKDLQNIVNINLSDELEQTKIFAKTILLEIFKINDSYINERLITQVIDHDENIPLMMRGVLDKHYNKNEYTRDCESWRRIKRNLNYFLNQELAKIKETEIVSYNKTSVKNVGKNSSPKSLKDIFNDPYKPRYEDFLKLLNTAFESEPVLNEELVFNNLGDNIQCLAVFFRKLKEKNIINIKLTTEYAEFISNNIEGMGTRKSMFSNTRLGSQKYNDNEPELERKLEYLIKSIIK